ncbi:MAG: N-acetyltransferase [Micrococcales bacterium]|nr:N-acetyltransferase [Micrococcales bacterium]
MTEIKPYIADQDFHQVQELYNSVNWLAYTKDSEKLYRALANSHLVLVAYSDQHIVGLVRCISDGEVICYIQDLLVTPSMQRKGIGRALLEELMSQTNVRQTVLMTDNEPRQKSFYESLGFRLIGDDLTGFVRLQR